MVEKYHFLVKKVSIHKNLVKKYHILVEKYDILEQKVTFSGGNVLKLW